ncbi:SAP domain-containing protein [Paenibacillus sp. J22TS3]|uniref:SAP domain-containing protein n=1 Tax=Paenibacillus sp. J22TS3 TaxID=2807192 RepID=UPI001B03818E|nr:SAP domain-containing protein [Paenibacillus sp. J22TS3]GIP24656.1 hypothetical protein J22TS3_49310 [Paenibacillus sp. J22TS3]
MSRTQRPLFSKNITIQEFEMHYWYKEELVGICRELGLPSFGTKAELEIRIKNLLAGEASPDRRLVNTGVRKKTELRELSLDTRLIPDGFKFNQTAREFFAKYYNKKKFSFTKEMAAALREAERLGDMEMTVADLIKIYEGEKPLASLEERTYQWNNFVKDFNKDARTKKIIDRMKVAAQLWGKVRDNPGHKRYSPDLLEEYLKDKRE